MIRIFKALAMLGALALAACETTGGTPAAVCGALIGPIKYNSANKTSDRYAGRELAPDLAIRNRVGVNLRCPEYR